MNSKGFVYLIGAGLGNAEFITLKGLECIKKCDVIIYDRLISYKLLDYVPENCERIYVGKEPQKHSKSQDEINKIIVDEAKKGKIVVRLKGGDPFVFGRGGEEVEAIKKVNIDFEVIPGVSSAIAAPEIVGIPVTHRGISRSFHIITGHVNGSDDELPEDLEKLSSLKGTLIFLMGIKNIKKIVYKLLEGGKTGDTPSAIISNAATSKQKVIKTKLENLAIEVKDKNISSPAVIVIGEVCNFEMISNAKKELQGIKIGVGGTNHITDKLYNLLTYKGAEVETIFKLKVVPINRNIFCEKIKNVNKYTWIVFTSANTVTLFFETLKSIKFDFRNLNLLKFAAIGNGTADKLSCFGFYADYIPNEFSTEALAKGLLKVLNKDDFLFIPHSLKSSDVLVNILNENNKKFDNIAIYDVTSILDNENNILHQIKDMDYLIFSSSYGVKVFFNSLNKECLDVIKNIKIVSIGSVTANELKKYSVNNIIIANDYSADGVADIICKDILEETYNEKNKKIEDK